MTTSGDHAAKRQSPPGRWLPAAFYALNVLLWLATGIAFGAFDVLYLAVVPLPVLAAYLWRTRR